MERKKVILKKTIITIQVIIIFFSIFATSAPVFAKEYTWTEEVEYDGVPGIVTYTYDLDLDKLTSTLAIPDAGIKDIKQNYSLDEDGAFQLTDSSGAYDTFLPHGINKSEMVDKLSNMYDDFKKSLEEIRSKAVHVRSNGNNDYYFPYEKNKDGSYSINNIYKDEELTKRVDPTNTSYSDIISAWQVQSGTSSGITEERAQHLAEETAEEPFEDQATEEAKNDEGLWGKLLDPLLDLLVTLADVVMNLVQTVMLPENDLKENSEALNIENYLVKSSEGTDKLSKSDAYYNKVGVDQNYTIDVDAKKLKKGWLNLDEDYYYPVIMYSPQEIFSGRIPSLDANFIKSSSEGESTERENLRKAIASWYIGLRNLSAVGLLSILVYLGIRIIISSSTTDKAKYKQLLIDWLMALLILFFIHYIMSFTLTIVDSIIKGVEQAGTSTITIAISGGEDSTESSSGGSEFTTNLIGAARFQAQYKDLGIKVHFVIMYIALVVYTLIFTFYYIKRLLMMAFLTMIAPLVALTYPIDKITDGQAQAFNSWLKEYVYNALLQPFHLIIYTVFVTNALEFAKSNVIYLIVSLWFVMEAEKILRGFFGFDKASSGTMGALHTLGLASMLGKMASGRMHIGGSNVGGQIQGTKPVRFHQSADLGKLSTHGNEDTEGLASRDTSEAYNLDARIPGGADQRPDETNAEYWDRFDREHGINAYESDNQNRRLIRNEDGGIVDISDSRIRPEFAEQLRQQEQNSQNWLRRINENTDGYGRKIKNFAYGNTFGLGRKAGSAIKGVAKLGTKTVFGATTGSLAAAIAIASGGDMAAAMAAFSAGAGVGARLGNTATNVVGKVPNFINTEIDMKNANNNRRNEAELKAKMRDENNANYVRDKIIKEEGRIPSGFEVSKRMKEYRPYLAKNLNMEEASKAMGIASKKGIDNEQAALMIAVIKERGITADILNKDENRLQAMANMKSELKQKGKSESEQIAITKGVFNFAADFYGVENIDSKIQREAQNAEGVNKEQQKTNNQKAEKNAGTQNSNKTENSTKSKEKQTKAGNNQSDGKEKLSHKEILERNREERKKQEEVKKNLNKLANSNVGPKTDNGKEKPKSKTQDESENDRAQEEAKNKIRYAEDRISSESQKTKTNDEKEPKKLESHSSKKESKNRQNKQTESSNASNEKQTKDEKNQPDGKEKTSTKERRKANRERRKQQPEVKENLNKLANSNVGPKTDIGEEQPKPKTQDESENDRAQVEEKNKIRFAEDRRPKK